MLSVIVIIDPGLIGEMGASALSGPEISSIQSDNVTGNTDDTKPSQGISGQTQEKGAESIGGELPQNTQPNLWYKLETINKSGTVTDGKGNNLIEYNVMLPRLNSDREAVANVNSYYENILEKDYAHIESDLKDMAENGRESQGGGGNAFIPFTVDHEFSVKVMNDKYFSITRQYYEYTGGAHGSNIMYGDTFDMSSGGKMTLSDVFKVSENEYLNIIFREVKAQIDKSEDKTEYFENYGDLIKTAYDTNDFYLTREGLNVIYQVYSLAPYSKGTLTFLIPYDSIKEYIKISY